MSIDADCGTETARACRIAIIAAVAENRVIGSGNDMPWRLSSDLKRFKALTLGKPVIMGRKTYQSIGRPLPGRANIVITRNTAWAQEGIRIAGSLDDALDLAIGETGTDEIFVIGGGQIYADAMRLADRLYITEVTARPQGDVVFPEIDPGVWLETDREGPMQGERDSAPLTFVTYERRTGSDATST